MLHRRGGRQGLAQFESDRSQPWDDEIGIPKPDLASSDAYLFHCGSEVALIDWQRLMPVLERVMTRLMVDVDALRSHLERLDADGNRFFSDEESAYGITPTVFLTFGPLAGGYDTLPEHLMMFSSLECITALASTVRKYPSHYWSAALAAPRASFVAGDLDDLAAERLYELTKILVAAADCASSQ